MSRSSITANSPVDLLLDGFIGYLREERGVSAATIAVYVPDVRRFVAQRGPRGIRDLSAAEVSKAVLTEVAGWSPATARRYGSALRVRAAGVPALLPPDRVDREGPVGGGVAGVRAAAFAAPAGHQRCASSGVAACLRSAPRDRAAGLDGDRADAAARAARERGRRAAVGGPRLASRPGHGARQERACGPASVSADLGEAIAGYLCRGRPRTAAREVFVRAVAPRLGLTRHGCRTSSLTPRAGLVSAQFAPIDAIPARRHARRTVEDTVPASMRRGVGRVVVDEHATMPPLVQRDASTHSGDDRLNRAAG